MGRFSAYAGLMVIFAAAAATAAEPVQVVATVDNQQITEAQVRVRMILDRVDSQGAEARRAIIEDLIDRALIRRFLTGKGIKIPDDLIGEQLQRLEISASSKNLDLAAELQRIGYPEAALRQDLWLPIAWSTYIRRETGEEAISAWFSAHHARFDGTTRHVRHLFLKAPADQEPADRSQTVARMQTLREEILAGKSTFEDVARRESESPSATSGGDLGFVHFHGDLPPAVAGAAFDVAFNEVSPVVESPYGVHLVTVTEEVPGGLSLEDARPEVLEAIALAEWTSTAARLRAAAKIQRVDSRETP